MAVEVIAGGSAQWVKVHTVTLLTAEGQGDRILPHPTAMIPDASCLQGSQTAFPSFDQSCPNTQTLISILKPPFGSLASL